MLTGDRVQDFLMYKTDKLPFTHNDLDGKKTLFLFFPAAFTSTCTKELCSVRDDIARYNEMKVDVYGISTDAVYSLIRYREEQMLNFHLASDFNKDVSTMFGCIYEKFNFNMNGVSKRGAFVIDENRIIRY